MKQNKLFLFSLLALLCNPFSVQGCSDKNNSGYNDALPKTKHSEFAGQFYPANKQKLTNALTYFFSDAIPSQIQKPIAIVAPHAGYIYSGQIAADAYNQAKNFMYDCIIILGTNHTTAGFNGVSAYSESGYETPLGTADINREVVNLLMKEDSDIVINEKVNNREHSVEVQIPFIQYAFPGTGIVPLVVGSPDLETCNKLGLAIANVMKNKSVLIVASSDLSHYPAFEKSVETDKNTLTAITSLNPEEIVKQFNKELNKNIPALATCACGEGPILAAIVAAKQLGVEKGVIISYANSGHTTFGDLNKVVGYGAVCIVKDSKSSTGNSNRFFDLSSFRNSEVDKINNENKKYLLAFARQTISRYLASDVTPLARNGSNEINIKRGAFVTLKKNGELRGCIGRMSDEWPLFKTIGSMAIEASLNDNRFEPVKAEELKNIDFEISILTPFRKVPNADYITLEKDGVLIKKNGRQAVFLPQVATETGWGKEKFLDQLCYKAGLKAGDWKDAEIFTFQADVFNEADFNISTNKK